MEINAPNESFRKFVKDAVQNLMQWNKQIVFPRGDGYVMYKGDGTSDVRWKLGFTATGFWIECEDPVAYIGANMRVMMGSNRLEIR